MVGGMGQVVGHLPSKLKAQSSKPSTNNNNSSNNNNYHITYFLYFYIFK
jgi:hypothetical protein